MLEWENPDISTDDYSEDNPIRQEKNKIPSVTPTPMYSEKIEEPDAAGTGLRSMRTNP